MKKLAVIVALTFFPGLIRAGDFDDNQSVLLRWKLAEGESIAYLTNAEPIDPQSEHGLKFDLSALAESECIPDEVKDYPIELKFPTKGTTTTIMTRKPGGNISIKLIVSDLVIPESSGSKVDEAMSRLWESMEGTVQLRGEIDESGQVTSFYLETPQRNLVAMGFELPKDPVKVGDTWSIDAHLLAMGHGFIAEQASRSNQVTLTGLSTSDNGDTVATIEYMLAEYVDGVFRHPMLDKDQPTTMSYGFFAEGKFLVNRGRWQEFRGRVIIKSTGMTQSDSQSHMSMTLMESVPENLLELE